MYDNRHDIVVSGLRTRNTSILPVRGDDALTTFVLHAQVRHPPTGGNHAGVPANAGTPVVWLQ